MFESDPRRNGDLRVEVNDVRRENALGKEEFVPQQTEAVHNGGSGATNFEKVRKGEWGKRRRGPLNRNERRIPPTVLSPLCNSAILTPLLPPKAS